MGTSCQFGKLPKLFFISSAVSRDQMGGNEEYFMPEKTFPIQRAQQKIGAIQR